MSPSERSLTHGACKVNRGVEGTPTLVSQDDELGPPVMRIRLECHKPFAVQIIDDPLHVLAISSQVAGKPRDGLGALCLHNGAKDLPAGARESEPGPQTVACG